MSIPTPALAMKIGDTASVASLVGAKLILEDATGVAKNVPWETLVALLKTMAGFPADIETRTSGHTYAILTKPLVIYNESTTLVSFDFNSGAVEGTRIVVVTKTYPCSVSLGASKEYYIFPGDRIEAIYAETVGWVVLSDNTLRCQTSYSGSSLNEYISTLRRSIFIQSHDYASPYTEETRVMSTTYQTIGPAFLAARTGTVGVSLSVNCDAPSGTWFAGIGINGDISTFNDDDTTGGNITLIRSVSVIAGDIIQIYVKTGAGTPTAKMVRFIMGASPQKDETFDL